MSRKRNRWLRRAAQGAALVGVVLAVLTVRVVVASSSELETARRLEAAGDVDPAILHYRRAARWYAPASPYPPEALDALARIGRAAEADGDIERALFALRSIRGAILSVESFYLPYEDRLDAANARIATLMARSDPPPIDAGKSEEALRAEHLALLETDTRPVLGFTVLLLAGFLAWLVATFAFASRAIDEEDRLVPREARRWGGIAVLGFALFVIGMWLA